MSQPNVEGREPVSLAELSDHMDMITERDEELNFRAGKTEEYVNEFAELNKDEFEELFDEIESLDVPRLKDKHIIKLIDFLPKTVEDLDVIIEGYPLTLSDEDKEAIVETITDYFTA
jgi:DNA-directed RNA polymerase subunit F